MKLKDRITKLEMKHGAQDRDEVDLIQIVIVSPDPNERVDNTLCRIECGGEEWLRDVGEPENAFIERALAAAKTIRPGGRVVCLGFPDLA